MMIDKRKKYFFNLLFKYLEIVALIALAPRVSLAQIEFSGPDKKQITALSEKFNLSDTRPHIADDIVRELMNTGSFEQVSAYKLTNGRVKVVAVPLKVLTSIQVTGNSFIGRRQILNVIDLEEDSQFDRRRIIEAGEKLKKYYGEQGFFNTVINIHFDKKASAEMGVRFEVNEGAPCSVTDIVFATDNEILAKRLSWNFRNRINQPFTSDLTSVIEAKAEEYFRNNRYLQAAIEQDKVEYNDDRTRAKIYYRIRNPFRYEVIVKGIETKQISDIFRIIDFDNFSSGSLDPASEMAEKVRQSYIKDAYPNVQVAFEEQVLEDKFIKRVYLEIATGPRVRIKTIEVSGRISRPSEYYANFIENNSSDLIDAGFYNRTDLEIGYNNLKTHLKNQGYLRARILSARIDYSTDRSYVNVHLSIDEGPLTQIRSISFSGTQNISRATLVETIGLQPNMPLHLNKLEESIEAVKDLYRSNGYLEMTIVNEDDSLVNYNDLGTQADIEFEIYEGPQVVVASVAVEGNDFTKNRVILQEIEFKTGDILTPQLIDESKARLNKLGLFSRVDIRTLEVGTKIAERTVVVSVSERVPGLVNFGAGVDNENGVTTRGFAGISYNNIGGTARGISTRVQVESNVSGINYPQHEIIVGYLEPYLFNTRTRGRVNLTRSEKIYDYSASEDIADIYESNRIDFLLENDLTSHTKLTWTLWSIDSRHEFKYPDRDPDTESTINISSIGPTLDLDFRDNPFLPTIGHHTRWDLDYSTPTLGSSELIEFLKTEASFTYYWRLGSPRLIWANAIRGGYLTNLSDKAGSGVPRSKAFFLGGLSTIRGFGTTGTERIPDEADLPTTGDQILIGTSSHYYLFKSELRFSIVGDFGGVLFYDGGAVHVEDLPIRRPYRHSIGFGFRYNTPVGPVALDLGFKIDPEDGEDEKRLHFSIGTF